VSWRRWWHPLGLGDNTDTEIPGNKPKNVTIVLLYSDANTITTRKYEIKAKKIQSKEK